MISLRQFCSSANSIVIFTLFDLLGNTNCNEIKVPQQFISILIDIFCYKHNIQTLTIWRNQIVGKANVLLVFIQIRVPMWWSETHNTFNRFKYKTVNSNNK